MNKINSLSLEKSFFLKALAIILVILIHTLSSFQESVFVGFNGRWQTLAVLIDKLCRFSVPLFVALSAHGLSQSYLKKPLNYLQFLRQRLWKLIPKYLLWCTIMILAVQIIPSWHSDRPSPPLSLLLLLGYADYHLYFVPMILQLYLIFPLLRFLHQRQANLTLLCALFIQVFWFASFSYQDKLPFNWPIFAEDHEQYLWATNWLFYFVLGMHLPKILSFLRQKVTFWNISLSASLLISWLVFSLNAIARIQAGSDPLLVLRFTQYSMIAWVSLGIISLSFFASQLKAVPKFMLWLGQKSYDLYLSHTLLLRLVFSFFVW